MSYLLLNNGVVLFIFLSSELPENKFLFLFFFKKRCFLQMRVLVSIVS